MYQSKISLGKVILNVNDLIKQKVYYQTVLGLSVIDEGEGKVSLGVPGELDPLIVLNQVEESRNRSYGLYHLAILLPNRLRLGQFLKHLITEKIPIQGAADHGYSEAIYLSDPEGNGIEVLADKPIEKWDIQGDQIIGVTLPLDGEDLLAEADDLSAGDYQIPRGSKMGHIHLSVRYASRSSEFYRSILPIQIKHQMEEHGFWMASGRYHHHLAVNQWAGDHLVSHHPTRPGLESFEVFLHDQDDFDRIISDLSKNQEINWEHQENQVTIIDPDGIKMHIILKK